MCRLRLLSTDLRPAALDDLGAQAAINDLARRMHSRGLQADVNLDFAHEHDRAPEGHNTQPETALYRIIQEALTNAHEQGHAPRASVDVHEDGQNTIRVTIHDGGQGFDPTAPSSGFGLLGMRTRPAKGGTLHVDSAPGHGTTVTASLPVDPARRSAAAESSAERAAASA
jgi:signal transduction histidine kinase